MFVFHADFGVEIVGEDLGVFVEARLTFAAVEGRAAQRSEKFGALVGSALIVGFLKFPSKSTHPAI